MQEAEKFCNPECSVIVMNKQWEILISMFSYCLLCMAVYNDIMNGEVSLEEAVNKAQQ